MRRCPGSTNDHGFCRSLENFPGAAASFTADDGWQSRCIRPGSSPASNSGIPPMSNSLACLTTRTSSPMTMRSCARPRVNSCCSCSVRSPSIPVTGSRRLGRCFHHPEGRMEDIDMTALVSSAPAQHPDWLVGNPSTVQIAAALWVGSVGLLILGLQPVLLGALFDEHRINLDELALVATAEIIAIGSGSAVGAMLFSTR